MTNNTKLLTGVGGGGLAVFMLYKAFNDWGKANEAEINAADSGSKAEAAKIANPAALAQFQKAQTEFTAAETGYRHAAYMFGGIGLVSVAAVAWAFWPSSKTRRQSNPAKRTWKRKPGGDWVQTQGPLGSSGNFSSVISPRAAKAYAAALKRQKREPERQITWHRGFPIEMVPGGGYFATVYLVALYGGMEELSLSEAKDVINEAIRDDEIESGRTNRRPI